MTSTELKDLEGRLWQSADMLRAGAHLASRYAELLGDVLKDTKSNLMARIEAEKGACAEKFEMAKLAKKEGSDALHDTIHEMAKDEARHCAGFVGLYNRYFK